MSSVQHSSEFVKEPQTAAAEEMMPEFEETTEGRKSHRTDLPEPNTSENLVCADQQLCNQDRISSLEENPDNLQIKEEPGHIQTKLIKEEEEEHHIVQEADLLFLKQESDGFTVTLTNVESHKSEPNNDTLHPHGSDTVRMIQSQSNEIFEDVKTVIVWYNEDGYDCQNRLLEVNMKPEPGWTRTDVSPQHVCQETSPSNLLLCNQEWNTSLDQKKPPPPGIKEEEDEHGIIGQREQLQLKQETDASVMPIYKGHDHMTRKE
ncbi:uncharacterized protein KZ484_020492 [Pholidichthys leucotaenia]